MTLFQWALMPHAMWLIGGVGLHPEPCGPVGIKDTSATLDLWTVSPSPCAFQGATSAAGPVALPQIFWKIRDPHFP